MIKDYFHTYFPHFFKPLLKSIDKVLDDANLSHTTMLTPASGFLGPKMSSLLLKIMI